MNQEIVDDPNFPLQKFAEKMLEELRYHNDEKTVKFSQMGIDEVTDLLYQEAQKRLPFILKAVDEMNEDQLIKETTHLANYCYFVAAKATTAKKHRDQNDSS